MADPIDQLRRLVADDLAPSTPPPPPTAVRRDGERLRRRRRIATGAAAAAVVVLLGAPVALLAGSPDRALDPPPATGTPTPDSPAPTPTPDSSERPGEPAPPDRIPDDFPLDVGMPAATVSDDAALAGLDYCGSTPLAGLAPRDVRSASLAGGETAVTRTLYLLDDAEAAAVAHRAVADAARACASVEPAAGEGDLAVHAGGDGGVGSLAGTAVTEDFARGAPTTEPSVQVVSVVDRGPALLVTSTFGSWTGDLATGVASARADVREVVAAMDVFGEPRSAAGSTSGGVIAADFPLAAAHRDLTGDGGEVLGPGAEVPGLRDEQVCGADLWTVPATDRLAFSSTGPEYADVRELRAFATTGAAVAQMTELRGSLAGCDREVRGGTTTVWTTYDADTGHDSVSFGATAQDALGGTVYQVTRVGRAVLAVAVAAEWSLETAPSGVDDLTATTGRLTPAMCAFTDGGC